MTWENSGALGGTRTPSLLIRRLRQVVQDCPGVAGCWADIPGLSSCVRNWPWAWQRFWQQSQPLVSTLGVSGGGFCSSGSSRTISSHSARHSLHIRVVPADAMAATRSRAFPQKLHCPAPGSSPTCWILAIGVLAVRPGAASTVCTRRMQPSQIYALGPAISFLTCFWLFPQNEHERWFPASGTRSLYRGRPSAPRLLIRRLFRGPRDLGMYLLTWRDNAHRCASLACVSRPCPGRIRPAGPGTHPLGSIPLLSGGMPPRQ